MVMINTQRIVTVFGGSGFLGRAVVAQLARAGYVVRVATREPKACYALKTLGTPGQVTPLFYHPGRPDTIGAAINGADAVVNCTGILYERRRSTFHAVHIELTRQIATACKRYHVARVVHLSALGIDNSRSTYGRTKRQGETILREICPHATILRSGVMFGMNDQFFIRFARLSTALPFLPLIGGGHTRLQPVYVEDVARAVLAVIQGDDTRTGRLFELGGPDVLDFRGVYERLARYTGIHRWLVSIPWWGARIKAFFLERLPGRLLTRDQVRSLETDSVVTPGADGFSTLGITPVALDSFLPQALARFRYGRAENKEMPCAL